MGKNTGADRVRSDADQFYEEERRRSSDRNKMLEGLFSPQYKRSNAMLEDAYGRYGDVYGDYGNLADRYEGLAGRYGEFADTGGADEYSGAARDYYRDKMETGGWSPEDVTNFRSRISRTATAANAATQEGMRQARATSGGPGWSPAMRSAARQGAFGAGEAVNEGEINMGESIRRGRDIGAEGTRGMWNDTTRNRLAGLGGMGGAYAGMGSAYAGKESATKGMESVGTTKLNFASKMIDNILENEALDNQTRMQILDLRRQLNPRISGWDRAFQIANAVAGLGSTALGLGMFQGVGGGSGGGIPQSLSSLHP